MDKDILQGKWQQLRGKVQERWGRLKDEDLDRIDGQRERLVERIAELYDQGRDWAEKEIDSILAERESEESTNQEGESK